MPTSTSPHLSHELDSDKSDSDKPFSEANIPDRDDSGDVLADDVMSLRGNPFSRSKYSGALMFNLATALLPVVYGTLTKLWVANIDSSLVVTTDVYGYIGIVMECFNEGLPRAAWSTIGDQSQYTIHQRLSLILTLIAVQSLLGILLSNIFIGCAPQFAGAFVPGPVKATTVEYIRILAFDSLASAVETATSLGTRALDRPDVPLVISLVKTALKILLEFMFLSTFHIRGVTPSIRNSAVITLTCDIAAAAIGLVYFLWRMRKTVEDYRPSLKDIKASSLMILFRPGRWTFCESAIRNAIYLYLVHNVTSMSQTYATAWGVFNTIRWGLIMVPVSALDATTNAIVGHRFARFVTHRDIANPALISVLIALCVEVPVCLIFSFLAVKPFAYYLSADEEVAQVVRYFWKTIDWTYICYAVSTCLVTLLLATRTRWYLYQSLLSNLAYCLPWAIVLSQITVTAATAWTYHALVFGGSLVVSLIIVLAFDGMWAYRLLKGKIH